MLRTAPTPALILGVAAVASVGAAAFLRTETVWPTLDIPLRDTFYVVGHLHIFIITAFICAIFAIIYLAAPQLSQRGIRNWLANFHAVAMAAVPLLLFITTRIAISQFPLRTSPASAPLPGFWIQPLSLVGILLALLFGNAAFVCASIIALVKRTQ